MGNLINKIYNAGIMGEAPPRVKKFISIDRFPPFQRSVGRDEIKI
jgi:hypothetical protein